MDHQTVLKHLDDERRNLVRDGEIIEALPRVTRMRWPTLSQYAVTYSTLDEGNADEAIRAEIEHHSRLNAEFEWKVYAHDAPRDLVQRMRAHGFEVGPTEAVMVFDLSHPPAWLGDKRAASVVRIKTLEQLEVWRRTAATIFGKDYSRTTEALAEALRAGSTQHLGYVAFVGQEPVSVGRLYTHPKSVFAGLYGGGTLAEHRGRGYYRAVIAARARDALELGAKYLIVDAMPTSRPILERLGFECVSETWPCEWKP